MWQLFVHSLGLPRVMLDAYKADGRAEFLDAAAEYLVAYDAYEGSGWYPGGYLWNDTWQRFVRNDHAVAARVPVLTEFWRLYRRSPNYRPNVAEAVFRMAARGAHLLADPSHFTVATNHGVMQNLATCNVGLSFPTLPGVEGHCRLAFKRLDEQLAFFINDEGFVLEHSPGYQGVAVVLIGIALRYLTLSEQEIPQLWLQKYQAAQRVYAEFRRPDGSLPVFGDTDGELGGTAPVVFAELRRINGLLPVVGNTDGRSGSAGPIIFAFDDQGRAGRPAERVWSPKDGVLLAPVAGYCLWWDGLDDWPTAPRLSQTAIAWSYFQGMGHKHADEMSMAVWAGGTSWWANLGYWSYDAAGREMAESWEGANAPHLVDERTDSPRETRLRYHGRDGHLAVIDLERRGPGPYRARRQVVHVGSRLWIVIDTSSGVKGARTRTAWTTSPSVRLTGSGAGGAYTLADGRTGQLLRAFFDGAPGAARRTIEGSRSPFGGWSVVGGIARSAPAIVVERPADGLWALAAWSLADEPGSEPGLVGAPRMHRWTGAEDWEVILPTGAGQVDRGRPSQAPAPPRADRYECALRSHLVPGTGARSRCLSSDDRPQHCPCLGLGEIQNSGHVGDVPDKGDRATAGRLGAERDHAARCGAISPRLDIGIGVHFGCRLVAGELLFRLRACATGLSGEASADFGFRWASSRDRVPRGHRGLRKVCKQRTAWFHRIRRDREASLGSETVGRVSHAGACILFVPSPRSA